MSIDTWLLDKFLSMEKKVDFLTQRSNTTMATLQDVQDKIAAEKVQVGDAMSGLKAEIQSLKESLAGGVVVTAEQLDALSAAVDGIFTPEVSEPAPVEPAPEVPAEPAPEVPAEPVADPVSDPAPVDGSVEPAA